MYNLSLKEKLRSYDLRECSVKDGLRSDELREILNLDSRGRCVQNRRVSWFSHIEEWRKSISN